MDAKAFFMAASKFVEQSGSGSDGSDGSDDGRDIFPEPRYAQRNGVDPAVTAREICLLLSNITELDLLPGSSAADALMAELDPDGFGDVTL